MKKSSRNNQKHRKVKKEKLYSFLFGIMVICYMLIPAFTTTLDEHIVIKNQMQSDQAEMEKICNIDDLTMIQQEDEIKIKNEETIEMLSASLVTYSAKAQEKELTEEKEEIQETVSDEVVESVSELDWTNLNQMKNNPWTPTLEFLPYLKGEFENNVELMAKTIHMESQNASDEEQQMQGLVLLGRSFHPYSFSDGTGDLESAIMRPGQYPWAKDGIEHIVPNEQAYQNARAVLTGNVLETENIKGITRNVEYANTTPLGYKTYCKIWNEPMEAWVYFDYGK